MSHVFPSPPGAAKRAGQRQAADSSRDVLTGPQGVGMSCRCRGVRLGRFGPAGAAAPLRERERGRQEGPYHPHSGGGSARDPPSPARAPPGEARGGTPAPRVVRPGPPVPAVHSDGRASRPAPAAGPTWLPRVPGRFRGPAPASLPRHGREALPGLLPGGGAAALPPLRPGGPLSAGHPARLHGGAARSEALRAVLPGGACPVIPFCFAWFPRGFGKMASPPPR